MAEDEGGGAVLEVEDVAELLDTDDDDVLGAAAAVLAVSGRFWRGWTRSQLIAAALFGITTAAMNTFFYMAIDRTDLGKSVAIEFIGPIVVAGSRGSPST